MNENGALLAPNSLVSLSSTTTSLTRTDSNLSEIQKEFKKRTATTSDAVKSKTRTIKNKVIKKKKKKATSADNPHLSSEAEHKNEIAPAPMFLENIDSMSSSNIIKKKKKTKKIVKTKKSIIIRKKKSASKEYSDSIPQHSLKPKRSTDKKKKDLIKQKGKAESEDTPDVPGIDLDSNKMKKIPKTEVQISSKELSTSNFKKKKIRKKKNRSKDANTSLYESSNKVLLNILTDGLTPSKGKLQSKPARPLPLMTVADTITIENFGNIFLNEGTGRNHRKPKARPRTFNDDTLKSPIEGWYNFQVDLIKPTPDAEIEKFASKEFDISVLLKQIKNKAC